jgi:hypothetical protein
VNLRTPGRLASRTPRTQAEGGFELSAERATSPPDGSITVEAGRAEVVLVVEVGAERTQDKRVAHLELR